MKAKVVITTNKAGDKVSEHAGHVRYFKIYEIDEHKGIVDTKVVKVEKENTLHNLLHSNSLNPLEHEILQAQILLTGGIGPGAINKLAHLGVRAYMIKEKNPDEAINQLLNNTLKAIMPTEHHHHHHHGNNGHHHEHGNDDHHCCGGHCH